ncbi:restriction endonuclease subunit S [Streptococcus thermophilus]|uniref:restriction endonuclease subunit S n=1 Tax=Streptococcus thermophilus TaxID=1308 RepID=UPI001E56D46B|nr:restriction endonuclease subunit S [Streptococcus thermophilus]MCD9220299.1 restriction endonuclease subunit S [Streptococcus thermophilus]
MSEKLTVKNVVNINKSTLSAKDNWSTLKYLDTGNITENQIDTLQIFQKGEKLPSRAKRKVEKGTIIYSTVRPNQKHFGYFDTHSNDLVVSTGFATLDVIDPRINSKYLYYLLTQNSVISQLQSIGENSTSSYPSIRPEDIGNLSFVFPDIDIQNKIADILTSIDKKIQINNQINQELEAMAKTLYDYWFVQFDFPDQNGNPYKSSGGKMVYHPELKREIPEGWGVAKLGDITICHDSKRVPLSSHEREHVKGEIPYYGATGIMDYVNDYIFDGDYVLMAEDGSVMTEKGTPILQRISGKNWVNNHAHVIEPVKNHSCKLLMMLLKDVSVMKIKTGSIQMKINQENMNKIVVPAIPLELLFEINQRLEVIDKQQLNLIEENKQLTQLRDWILPMLMNGQVKVE